MGSGVVTCRGARGDRRAVLAVGWRDAKDDLKARLAPERAIGSAVSPGMRQKSRILRRSRSADSAAAKASTFRTPPPSRFTRRRLRKAKRSFGAGRIRWSKQPTRLTRLDSAAVSQALRACWRPTPAEPRHSDGALRAAYIVGSRSASPRPVDVEKLEHAYGDRPT